MTSPPPGVILTPVRIRIKALRTDIVVPSRATKGSVGWDLHAYLPGGSVLLQKQNKAIIPTGIAIAIPSGYEMQVRPRSGLAFHNSISILNSPGTIDSDFRGEIKIIMFNNSTEHDLTIKHHDRVAQMVLQKVPDAVMFMVNELDETDRGEGGFGSTGR